METSFSIDSLTRGTLDPLVGWPDVYLRTFRRSAIRVVELGHRLPIRKAQARRPTMPERVMDAHELRSGRSEVVNVPNREKAKPRKRFTSGGGIIREKHHREILSGARTAYV